MTRTLVYIGVVVLIILGAGIIAGGGCLIWKADDGHTCNDWSMESKYYPTWTCGYTKLNVIAKQKCDTLCYCQSITYDYDCLATTPSGPSPTRIPWGVILIIVGIACIISGIVLFIKCL
jgi:hypothetical protein